ncbi:MAG: PaaI family thioesterase [Gammaproteobacteria bacterium]|nr:PaaI family thioesterase [Gammaproteobacteria bacterium]
MEAARITAAELEAMAREDVPLAGKLGLSIEHVAPGEVTVRAPNDPDFIRPGGTVAGPVLMAMADFAMYGAVLSRIGRVDLAVTTNLNINFLRRPALGDVVARARLLKLGKRLAVGEVSIYSDGSEELVAHVTATYSIPPRAEADEP